MTAPTATSNFFTKFGGICENLDRSVHRLKTMVDRPITGADGVENWIEDKYGPTVTELEVEVADLKNRQNPVQFSTILAAVHNVLMQNELAMDDVERRLVSLGHKTFDQLGASRLQQTHTTNPFVPPPSNNNNKENETNDKGGGLDVAAALADSSVNSTFPKQVPSTPPQATRPANPDRTPCLEDFGISVDGLEGLLDSPPSPVATPVAPTRSRVRAASPIEAQPQLEAPLSPEQLHGSDGEMVVTEGEFASAPDYLKLQFSHSEVVGHVVTVSALLASKMDQGDEAVLTQHELEDGLRISKSKALLLLLMALGKVVPQRRDGDTVYLVKNNS